MHVGAMVRRRRVAEGTTMGTITHGTMEVREAAGRPRVTRVPGSASRLAVVIESRLAVGLASRLAAVPAAAFAAWRRRRRVAAGIAAMRALDEHGLRDLGIDRGGIESAARGGR
jgi:uncharacterized protein YjiS (DUF1127 family)